MSARMGTFAVSTAAVLWAAGATVASGLFDRGAAPIQLTAARAWVGAIGIWMIVALRRRPVENTGRPFAIIPFGLSIAAANYFYYFSISRLPVAIAIVIQYTAPGLVVLWGALTTRTHPGRRVLTALAAALVGVALLAEVPQVIARGEFRLDALGVLAAAGSSVAFAMYMITGEHMGRRYRADGALARGFTIAGIFWIVVLLPQGRPDTLLDTAFTGGIMFVAVGATIAPFLLFLWGLGHVGPARAGITSTLEPLAGAVLAFAFLDQTLSVQQLIGAVFVVVGIGVVQSVRPRSRAVATEAAAIE